MSPVSVGVFFDSGDLGEVGLDVVLTALSYPVQEILTVRVFSTQIEAIKDCLVDVIESCNDRLEFVHFDLKSGVHATQLTGLDTVICCLGNRKPFYYDFMAEQGTKHIIAAMAAANVTRIVMLSSVGIGDDWPPLEWHVEGSRLQGFFRTICWRHFQDLSGAELAVRRAATAIDSERLQFLIVRAVFLSDSSAAGSWHVQEKKYQDHPEIYMSKMDCAAYLVSEALSVLTNKAVVLGGVPAT